MTFFYIFNACPPFFPKIFKPSTVSDSLFGKLLILVFLHNDLGNFREVTRKKHYEHRVIDLPRKKATARIMDTLDNFFIKNSTFNFHTAAKYISLERGP